jgi:hypothetical protein
MAETDVESVVQRALEKYPGAKPRIITDNGPQFELLSKVVDDEFQAAACWGFTPSMN